MLLAMESGKTYSVDMLSAIHLLAYSWQQVEPTAIQNCFARAHFTLPTQQVSPSEADATEEDIADSDCEALITEVLERQGAATECCLLRFAMSIKMLKRAKTCRTVTSSIPSVANYRAQATTRRRTTTALNWRMCRVLR